MIWALTLAVLPAAAVILALLVALLKERRHGRELERLLDDANGKLEGLQRNFARFAPEDVIERLTEPGGGLKPSRRPVTVLFADLRGFTRMCDRMDPEAVVPILNGYFQSMNGVIRQHHGRVTELIGDGLLALFGALEPNPWQVQDAVLGALAMRQALASYNEQLRARALPELRFGIGIHRGEVLAGVIGFEELSKFGVVGDTINVAARVERLTRVHDVDLLVTEEVRGALDTRFRLRAMPPVPVKGKEEAIVTYLVVGLDEGHARPAPPQP
jgi:adenylate cyclase